LQAFFISAFTTGAYANAITGTHKNLSKMLTFILFENKVIKQSKDLIAKRLSFAG
jgi:hypothetical protein